MKDKRLRFPIAVAALLLMVAVGYTAEVENQQANPRIIHVELSPESAPASYPMRAEFVDSFERAGIAPWTTGGDAASGLWGIRDTTNTYGPQAPAWDGYRYAGHPSTDIPEYPSPGSNPGYLTWIASPTIDITGWPALYISFSYWSDLEGAMTNFDGAIVQISPNNGTTWLQVDSNAVGHLNPTYDAHLANTGQLGTRWAYCYSTNPDWVTVSSQDLMALGYVAAGNQIKVRVNFAYDALSGGQGFFIDDVYIGDAPPPDLQPPVIAHTPLLDTPDTLSNYTVTTTITSRTMRPRSPTREMDASRASDSSTSALTADSSTGSSSCSRDRARSISVCIRQPDRVLLAPSSTRLPGSNHRATSGRP
ncbi:hypothetical protein IBX73_01205 [candidate division WOR-3 bacterium]|nr:hypothetical protein [candidate division WOR-3 bacterium]